jgi:hypothetical protein
MSVIYKMNKPKSTVSAIRLKSVSEDESEVSTAYVIAKDEEGNIAELRSLPNGTKDEIRVSEGKLVKRVSDEYIIQANDIVATWNTDISVTVARLRVFSDMAECSANAIDGKVILENYSEAKGGAENRPVGSFWCGDTGIGFGNTIFVGFPKGTTIEQIKQQLAGLKLTYQLATPIEKPIQVSGSLVSYPSGTMYIEPFVADAGIYTDKMTVLHQDLPIKALEKLSKIDFTTGLETELDVSDAVIAENKLSFTHPDLVAGDIVFFTYEYDRESTEGETEIEYYDSRYVIKDSVTGKFYKWHIAVADGVPSIELTEV